MNSFVRAATLVHDDNFSLLRKRSGLRAGEWSALPCFVGSSSYAIGRVEAREEPQLAPPIEFAEELARSFGVSGPVLLASSACTSGFTALQLALDLMGAGAFGHALVLGVELPNRLTEAGFRSLGLGTRLGSALGALVVSNDGAWRIASLAWQADHASLTAVSRAAMEKAMREALSRAAWQAGEVELVKLQAEDDPQEREALAAVFSRLPPCISLKPVLGHTLGASGPAELALLLEQPRPERRILFNVSGFGGQVASLALERT